jgi:hypothetical protein
MNPHLRTEEAGVVRISITTNRSYNAVRRNHSNMTPSSIGFVMVSIKVREESG